MDALLSAAKNNSWGDANEIRALDQTDDEKTAQFLIGMVERDEWNSGAANYALVKRGDDRAIPHLVHILLSEDPKFKRTVDIADRTIAEYRNENAHFMLEPLMTHSNLKIRSRAIAGMIDLACCGKDKSTKLNARDLLKHCQTTELDKELRRYIDFGIELS